MNAPSFKVYKVKLAEEYKKKVHESSKLENSPIDRSELKNIVKIEMVKKYDVSHDWILPGYYGEDSTIFNQL